MPKTIKRPQEVLSRYPLRSGMIGVEREAYIDRRIGDLISVRKEAVQLVSMFDRAIASEHKRKAAVFDVAAVDEA
jgi:hypothetical protein